MLKAADDLADYEYFSSDIPAYKAERIANEKWLCKLSHSPSRLLALRNKQQDVPVTCVLPPFDREFNRLPDYAIETDVAHLLAETNDRLKDEYEMTTVVSDEYYRVEDIICAQLLIRTASDDTLMAITGETSFASAISVAIGMAPTIAHKRLYTALQQLDKYIDTEVSVNCTSLGKDIKVMRPLWYIVYFFVNAIHWQINVLRVRNSDVRMAKYANINSLVSSAMADLAKASKYCREYTNSMYQAVSAMGYSSTHAIPRIAHADIPDKNIFGSKDTHVFRDMTVRMLAWLNALKDAPSSSSSSPTLEPAVTVPPALLTPNWAPSPVSYQPWKPSWVPLPEHPPLTAPPKVDLIKTPPTSLPPSRRIPARQIRTRVMTPTSPSVLEHPQLASSSSSSPSRLAVTDWSAMPSVSPFAVVPSPTPMEWSWMPSTTSAASSSSTSTPQPMHLQTQFTIASLITLERTDDGECK